MQPSQPFPSWGMSPGIQPDFASPVFAQLFDFGSLLRLLQEAAQNQAADAQAKRRMEEWIRTFSAFTVPPMSGAPVPAAHQQNPWANLFNLNQPQSIWNLPIPDAPALGITREYQEDWNRLLRLRQDCDTAFWNFSELFQEFSKRVSESFVDSISSANEAMDFRALSRKWIDHCESEFQVIAQSSEFSDRFGQLINANLKLLRHGNRIREKFAGLQGQPTRGELDVLQRQNLEAQMKITALENRIREMESSIASPRKNKPKTRKSDA